MKAWWLCILRKVFMPTPGIRHPGTSLIQASTQHSGATGTNPEPHYQHSGSKHVWPEKISCSSQFHTVRLWICFFKNLYFIWSSEESWCKCRSTLYQNLVALSTASNNIKDQQNFILDSRGEEDLSQVKPKVRMA